MVYVAVQPLKVQKPVDIFKYRRGNYFPAFTLYVNHLALWAGEILSYLPKRVILVRIVAMASIYSTIAQ